MSIKLRNRIEEIRSELELQGRVKIVPQEIIDKTNLEIHEALIQYQEELFKREKVTPDIDEFVLTS